ncbi:hypothetical protein [Jannaschia sp. W003]|uniref:hypothetical protein n=1 Tax=Jannaschia sp. W003 TaxID=2867012 RepID=UPI0021A42440|nr:hypothetical protein [Jannaschia sp. W003]UWQ22904.1 hypothetical protein K3554_07730 [Jannaschia sp. W003]
MIASTTLFALGLAIWFFVSLDLVAVTIGATTRFTVTGWIGRFVFGALRRIAKLGARPSITAISGVAVMTAVALFWIVGTWLGWSLMFAAGAGSVEMTVTGAEPEPLSYAAHVGHLLSTLGGARTELGGLPWSLLGVLVGVNGMVVLTLSVSFLLSVRQTVDKGRAFAALQNVGALRAGDASERLAELVAGLHAAPFALWYGEPRVERQLPSALLDHARDAEARGGTAWRRTVFLLADLPHLDRETALDEPIPTLEAWAERHTIAELHHARGAEA